MPEESDVTFLSITSFVLLRTMNHCGANVGWPRTDKRQTKSTIVPRDYVDIAMRTSEFGSWNKDTS